MPNFLFPLILLLTHFTAICASETSSGEMDLNSILIQPADANKFLSAKGVAKGVHAGGRRLRRCGSGTWWGPERYDEDTCHDCGTGQYQNENIHRHTSCKGKKVVLVVFVFLFYLAATCIIFTPEPDIFIYIIYIIP